jgi:hypothetical protein
MAIEYFKVARGLTTGNITLDAASGNISASYIVGNGAGITSISAAAITGTISNVSTAVTVTASAQPNITSVGILTSVSATGNISGNYFIGNGSQLTGLPEQYSNANVAAYLPTYTGNLVSLTGNVITTANISGAYFIGNGSQLTGLPESYSNANVAAYLPTYTGNLVSLTGNVITTANISGAYFIGNGSQLTGLPESYSNVYFLQGTTSNNTETELFVNGELGNRITVPVDSSMYYTIDITCRRTDGSDFAAFTLKSVVSNAGNTVTDVGAVYEIVVARTDASISVDARADDANNSIGVYVTGVTGKSFTWKAQVTVVEV